MKKNTIISPKEKTLCLLILLTSIGIYVETIFYSLAWLGIGLLTVLLISVIVLIMSFVKRLSRISKYAEAVDNNILPKENDDKIQESALFRIKSMYFKIQEITDFVSKLGDKNYEFKYLSADGPIGSMLNQLSKKQSEYLEEERKRSWKNEGLAKFSELLRMDDKDINEFSYLILNNLIKYIGANQGGFFIEEDDENEDRRYMTLTACYAYERKKFVEARVYEGQGLIGQVMLEKTLLKLTDVPSDYVRITSGLGEATPSAILIVPLIVNEKFYGAIEIASFEIFEEYKIDFIIAVAENIASTVAAVKINDRTRKLLDQSQTMAQELQSREEEMRQNMEELQATQEEMERNKLELDGVFGALNNSQGLVEFDQHGELIAANQMIQDITGYNNQELKQKPFLLLPKDNELEFWENLRNGKNIELELKTSHKKHSELWLNANYSPVLDSEGTFKKVLVLLLNITARKAKEREFEKLSLVADNTNNAVIITDKDGLVEYVNPGFSRLTKYTLEEMLGRKPGHILQGPETDKNTVNRIKESIMAREALYDEILNYDKDGNSYWISIAINPVFDASGNISKFISVQADITETKKTSLDFKNKLDAIDRSNAVVEFDMDGMILSANDNFLKIVKFKKEELEGQHHSILLPAGHADSEDYKQFWATLRRGQFVNQEFKRVNKRGKEIWLRGIYNPLLNMDNEPFKVVKFATDITKEKELFIQTAKQSKELSSHLETLNKTIATLEFDSKGNITEANKVYLDISGYKIEDLLKKPYDFILSEDERNKPQNKMMWQSLMEGHFFTGQFKQKAKNGSDLWLLGTFNPVLNDDDSIKTIKMFAQFNTLEKEKEINSNRVLGIYNSMMPVIELNPQGLCVKANESFHAAFSLTRMDLRNKQINDIFEMDFSPEHFNELINELSEGHVIEDLISYTSKEGNMKIFRAVFNPISSSEGELKKILLVLIDKEMIVKIGS